MNTLLVELFAVAGIGSIAVTQQYGYLSKNVSMLFIAVCGLIQLYSLLQDNQAMT